MKKIKFLLEELEMCFISLSYIYSDARAREEYKLLLLDNEIEFPSSELDIISNIIVNYVEEENMLENFKVVKELVKIERYSQITEYALNGASTFYYKNFIERIKGNVDEASNTLLTSYPDNKKAFLSYIGGDFKALVNSDNEYKFIKWNGKAWIKLTGLSSEGDTTDIINQAKFKSILSNSTETARQTRGRLVEVNLQKLDLLIDTNAIPQFTNFDDAINRRLLFIRFINKIPLEKMEALTDKAKEEKRALNVNEINRFNDIKEEIRAIDETLKIEEEQRSHIEWVPGKKKEGHTTGDKELRVFKEGEKIDIETRGKDVNLSIGKLVRAMSGIEKTGEGAQYLRDMSSATGSVVIPQKLANQILHKAREQSAIFGKIPVTVMENNNLTVARISKDASASFVAEGDLIPESSTEFIGVKLEGKTLAMYVPVTEQLVASANISNVLMNACSKAIAIALDKNLLYGTGTGAEIKGITAHDNINKVAHTGNVDYNMLIKGIGVTKGANIVPSDIVYNTTVGTDLSMLTDANGQYIVPPRVLDNYTISESNNIADNQALVYHRECMLLGVNKDIQMEWGYTQDGFQRMIKALRIYIRCDLGIVNEKGISLVTATT